MKEKGVRLEEFVVGHKRYRVYSSKIYLAEQQSPGVLLVRSPRVIDGLSHHTPQFVLKS